MTNWQSRWLAQDTPWDLKGSHPETERLMQLLIGWRIPLMKVLIPGCGRAHDAAVFLKQGLEVTGVDLSEEAIRTAKDLWKNTRGLELIASTNEEYALNHKGLYSLVFDRAMLCALSPEVRPRYVKAVTDVLASGGIFSSIAFHKLHGEFKGPPFAIQEEAMTRLFTESFTLMGCYRVAAPSPLPVVAEETLWIWKKAQKNPQMLKKWINL